MPDPTPVAVTSRSFSRHPVLRAEIELRYSDVRFNDDGLSLSGDKLIAFLSGRRKAITALEQIDDELLGALPDLEVISKVGVGIDMLDLDAMRRHDVRLGWARGTNARSVAELVISLTLALLRHIPALDHALRAGAWEQRKGMLLSSRTVGIVGYGAVGREVAALVTGFGCPVLIHDIVAQADLPPHVRQVPLDELMARSDVVTLHVGSSVATRNIIDATALARMRAGSVLVNTARGDLVDEAALYQSLTTGGIGGAALDVFASEPPTASPLLELSNVVLTPHIGGSSEEAILAMGRAAIAGLDSAVPIDELQ